MTRTIWLTVLTLGVACDGGADFNYLDDDSAMDDGGVDTSGGNEAGCTALQEGTWDLTGSAFGLDMDMDMDMDMDGTLTLDSTGCAFAFSDWNMNVDVPDGGSVSGDEVTLNGTGNRDWGNCVGTASSGTGVSGVCSDDGAEFNMVAQ